MDKFRQDVQNILGITLSPRQVAALSKYEEELLSWNEKYNLTAIRDSTGIRTKHFLDSLSCLTVLRDNLPTRLIDLGTGAGFPGIPLKIALPNLNLTLVDSVGKKMEFCRHLISTLKLEKVEIIQARAEDLGQMANHREQYDWAVARSVANLPTLVEYLLPLVRVGGVMLSQKGDSGPAEAQAADRAIHWLGGRLRQLRKIELPGVAEERYLITIDKVAATPPQYPRRVGIPTKKPLR